MQTEFLMRYEKEQKHIIKFISSGQSKSTVKISYFISFSSVYSKATIEHFVCAF